jgi:hypothetical protein
VRVSAEQGGHSDDHCAEGERLMFVASTIDGDLVGPADDTDGLELICPDCKEPVIAKRGEIMEHHFAHIAGDGSCTASSDPWAEPMTAWHRDWQRWFATEGCATEVPAQGRESTHRADIITPDGLVIEVQHSPIDVRDIRAREAFWQPMIWIWDAERIANGVTRNQKGEEVDRLSWRSPNGTWVETSNTDVAAVPNRAFKWRRPAISTAKCEEPLFWDCGQKLGVWWMNLIVESGQTDGRRWHSVTGGIMRRMTHVEFIADVMNGRWSGVAPADRELAGMFRRAGIGVRELI